MAFDFLGEMKKSVVAKGLAGKIIMVYGGNNLGKSKQSVSFPKSITIPLEPNALNAIGDQAYLPIYDWSSFRDFVESLHDSKVSLDKLKFKLKKLEGKTTPKEVDEKKEYLEDIKDFKEKIESNKYSQFRKSVDTIVLDSLTALDKTAEFYVTECAGVEELSDVAHGKLYKRFENEFYKIINKFFSLGDFTYLILAHEGEKDFGTEEKPNKKKYPKGTYGRVVKPVIDRCDIIAYLTSNGVDEDGKTLNSSAYLAETSEYFARTKWDNMDTVIPIYTAKNLEAVIEKALSEQAESGVTIGDFSEQQKSFVESESLDFDTIQTELKALGMKIYHSDDDDSDENMSKFTTIVDEILGQGVKIATCTKKQVKQLNLILNRTKELAKELKL